jgi:hypothetical protein
MCQTSIQATDNKDWNNFYTYITQVYKNLLVHSLPIQKNFEQLNHLAYLLSETIQELSPANTPEEYIQTHKKLNDFYTQLTQTYKNGLEQNKNNQNKAIQENDYETLQSKRLEEQTIKNKYAELNKQHENNTKLFLPKCKKVAKESIEHAFTYIANKEKIKQETFFSDNPNLPIYQTNQNSTSLCTYLHRFISPQPSLYIDQQSLQISDWLTSQGKLDEHALEQIEPTVKTALTFIHILKTLENHPYDKPYAVTDTLQCISIKKTGDLRCKTLQENLRKCQDAA